MLNEGPKPRDPGFEMREQLRWLSLLVLLGLLAGCSGERPRARESRVAAREPGRVSEWRELLANGSLEEESKKTSGVPAGWEFEANRLYRWDATQAHSGKRSARCSGAVQGITQGVVLDPPAQGPFLASAWSKAEAVPGHRDMYYALYCDVVYADGTVWYNLNAPFDCGTHDWQKREVFIVAQKPVKRINFWIRFGQAHAKGTAWFDDMSLKQAVAEQE